jgi:hypothetical protein
MGTAVTNVPARQSWRWLTVGLILFVLITAGFQFFFPIAEGPLLLIPIIAVCAVVGWLGGARPMIALLWVALAIWFLVTPLGADSPYAAMARGWALILAGSFGLVSLWNSSSPFLVRALATLGLAIGTAFILAVASPGGIDRVQTIANSEFSRRSKQMVAMFEAQAQSPANRARAAQSPAFTESIERMEAWVLASPRLASVLVPSVLALESLAALALGWAVYQRISEQKIGPRLSPLREFKFNDQLVWGVAVGATLLMLPAFQEGRNAGLNLMVFFGALYFLRGMGVLAWFSRQRAVLVASLLILFLLLPLLRVLVGAVICIGLGDTWLDWRNRPAPGSAG